MRHSVNRAEVLRRLAREEGFGLAGIAAPDPSRHSALLDLWVREGWAGTMAYMARPANLARRGDLRRIMPEVRSVLVVGQNYFREDPGGVPTDPARGVIARYARGRDYHRVIAGALRRVHRRFEEAEGRRVAGRVYVDTGPVLERELAERAGLGWFGRNTMMIHPRRGSYFFLGILLLAVEVEPDAPLRADHCGSCRACLDACPTSALLGRGADGAPVMDASRCISYLTIEHRGPIPHELRPRIGNRIYGCDICQEVCPFNERFARPAAEPGYAPRAPGELPPGVEPLGGPDPVARHPGTDGPHLTELMGMDPCVVGGVLAWFADPPRWPRGIPPQCGRGPRQLGIGSRRARAPLRAGRHGAARARPRGLGSRPHRVGRSGACAQNGARRGGGRVGAR